MRYNKIVLIYLKLKTMPFNHKICPNHMKVYLNILLNYIISVNYVTA